MQPLGRPPAFSYRASSRESGKRGNAARRVAPPFGEVLHCEEMPLSELARRFGTPLYVYSASTIRERAGAFDRAFGSAPHTVCYSVKANSSFAILRLLAGLGFGFDVVSGGELERVVRVDRRAAKKVVFSGVGKTRDEIELALQAGILLFNVESASELSVLAESAARKKKTARVALRVNPDVPAETHPYISTGLHEHKFGIPVAEALALYRQAAKEKFLRVAGVSVHIGSQITDVAPFTAAMQRVAKFVGGLRRQGHEIHYVDAGGGLGIDYHNEFFEDFALRAHRYARALLAPLRRLRVHLLLEPGRAIVAPAGVLLTRILYKKGDEARRFVVVDAAMNDLIRPSLYDAFHEIVPVCIRPGHALETADVVGPICETGDFFARGRKIPAVHEGDLLAILDAGAYGMSLASNYNTRPRSAEVLVERNSARLARRRETITDLVRLERA